MNNSRKYYTWDKLFEARVERTIDPKLWASVSSGCSKTYKADLGNSAKVPSGTADQLLARYVAGLIILKQQCPETIQDMQNAPAFRQWAKKLADMGVSIEQVHNLWNENCGKLPKMAGGATPAAQTPAPTQTAPVNDVTVEDDEDDFQLGDINIDSEGNPIAVKRGPRYIPRAKRTFTPAPEPEPEPEDEVIEEPVDEEPETAEVEVYDRTTGERYDTSDAPVEDEDDDIAFGESFDEDEDEDEVINEPEPEVIEDVPDDDEYIDYSTSDDIDEEPVDEPVDDEDNGEEDVDFNNYAAEDEEIDDAVQDDEEAIEFPDDEVEDEPVANDRPGIADYSEDEDAQMTAIHKCMVKDKNRVFSQLHGCSDPDECLVPVPDMTRRTGIVPCENLDEAIEECNKPGARCFKMKVYNGDPEEVKGDILWIESPCQTEYYVIVHKAGARIYYKDKNGELSLTWVGDLEEFGFRE